jgi:hypothetical protein
MKTFMKDGIPSSGIYLQTNPSIDTSGFMPPEKELAQSMKSDSQVLRQSTTQMHRTLAVLSS